VKYRVVGESGWHDGQTVSLSPSGAVIAGDLPTPLNGPIAVVISLTPASGCLTACGRIVRTQMPDDPVDRFEFAIAVPQYSVEHGATALTRLASLLQGC